MYDDENDPYSALEDSQPVRTRWIVGPSDVCIEHLLQDIRNNCFRTVPSRTHFSSGDWEHIVRNKVARELLNLYNLRYQRRFEEERELK